MPDLQSNPDNIGMRERVLALPEAEKPTRAETFASEWRVSSDDIGHVQRGRRDGAYREVVRRMKERRGIGAEGFFAFQNPRQMLPVIGLFVDQYDGERVWNEIQSDRVAATARGEVDPWDDLPSTREEFEMQVARREVDYGGTALFGSGGFSRSEDQATLNQSDYWGVSLLAGLGSQVQDPFNLATAPVGGSSKSLSQAVYRGFIINAGIETVMQPAISVQRERMGERLSAGEAGVNIALGGAFGGVLGGAGYGVARNWDSIKAMPRAAQERLWGSILERSPQLRERLGSTVNWDAMDSVLPDIVEDMGKTVDLPDDVIAARQMMEREGRFASANPFGDNPAGRRAYHDNLALALVNVMEGAPTVAPRAFAASPSARARSGTAISTRTVGAGSRDVLKRSIGRVESGGDDLAKNPRSSATGRYQFIRETWLRLYKNRYGARGQSDDEIASMRGNVRLQERLMDDLVDMNETALQVAGIEGTAGNLYLAHFAGSAGARRLHAADPSASARDILGADVINANPFLRGMSARDVIAWAHDKMGQTAPTGRGGGASAGQSVRDQLQADLDRLSAERDALRDLAADGAPSRSSFDAVPSDEIALDVPARLQPMAESDVMSEAANDIMPDLRAIVDDYRTSISDRDALARRLGAERADVDAAIERLVGLGELRLTAKGTAIRPRRNVYVPEDYIGSLAQRGGINPQGLGKKTREANKDSSNPVKGHDLRNSGNFNKFIPGVGPLLRPEGRGLDEIGEELWEMGAFGPVGVTPRPDEGAVIGWLDDVIGSGRKIDLNTGLDIEARQDGWQERGYVSEQDFNEQRGIADGAARAIFGRELTDAEFRAVEELEQQSLGMFGGEDGLSPDDWMEARYASAILANMERDVDDLLDRAYMETEDFDYANADDIETQLAREVAEAGEGRAGQAPDAGNPRAGEGAGGDGKGSVGAGDLARFDETPPPLSPEDYLAFQRTDGPGVQAQAESAVHDLRAAVERAETKASVPDEADLLVMRSGKKMGDFIEFFGEDAKRISDALGITLTSRGGEPMAGMPVHAYEQWRADALGEGLVLPKLGLDGKPLDASPSQADFAVPTQDQRRVGLERQTEGRKKGSAPQRAVGSDGGLFDTRDTTDDLFQATQFRLDADGPEMSAQDILADLDADAAMLKNIKDCL